MSGTAATVTPLQLLSLLWKEKRQRGLKENFLWSPKAVYIRYTGPQTRCRPLEEEKWWNPLITQRAEKGCTEWPVQAVSRLFHCWLQQLLIPRLVPVRGEGQEECWQTSREEVWGSLLLGHGAQEVTCCTCRLPWSSSSSSNSTDPLHLETGSLRHRLTKCHERQT